MRIGGPPEITPPLTLGPFTIGRAGINRVAEQADGHEPGERIGRRPFDIDFLPPFLCLYISHALITGTERLWQFALPLLLIQIYPKFLLPSSILLFFVLTGKILLIPPLAKWSQRFEKLTLIALATALPPILVCCSVSLVYSLHQSSTYLHFENLNENCDLWVFITQLDEVGITTLVNFVCMAIFLMIAEVVSKVSTVHVEKDWVTRIAYGHERNDPNFLSKLNGRMRVIDLSCAIIFPLLLKKNSHEIFG